MKLKRKIITEAPLEELAKEYGVSYSYLNKVLNFTRNSTNAMILRAKILLNHNSQLINF